LRNLLHRAAVAVLGHDLAHELLKIVRLLFRVAGAIELARVVDASQGAGCCAASRQRFQERMRGRTLLEELDTSSSDAPHSLAYFLQITSHTPRHTQREIEREIRVCITRL